MDCTKTTMHCAASLVPRVRSVPLNGEGLLAAVSLPFPVCAAVSTSRKYPNDVMLNVMHVIVE